MRPLPPELKTYRLLRSDPKGLFFNHESVHDAVFNVEMRKVFWDPLDELIERARR